MPRKASRLGRCCRRRISALCWRLSLPAHARPPHCVRRRATRRRVGWALGASLGAIQMGGSGADGAGSLCHGQRGRRKGRFEDLPVFSVRGATHGPISIISRREQQKNCLGLAAASRDGPGRTGSSLQSPIFGVAIARGYSSPRAGPDDRCYQPHGLRQAAKLADPGPGAL